MKQFSYFFILCCLYDFYFHFKGQEEHAGRIGALMIFAGMIASFVTGRVLDKTRLFKYVIRLFIFRS